MAYEEQSDRSRGGRGENRSGRDRNARSGSGIAPGHSEIELIGIVAGQPSYSDGRSVPSLWLSVHTQLQLDGANREIKGFHPISIWGDLAAIHKDSFLENDVVSLTGRIAYEPGDGDGDPPRARIKIGSGFGTITRLDGDQAKETPDRNSVRLEGVVRGEPRYKEGQGDQATYLAFEMETVVKATGGHQSFACHEVVVWDRAAVEANKLVAEGTRVNVEQARLQYVATRRGGRAFAPRITVDDLSGTVTLAA